MSALLLALTGIYAVVAFTISMRTQEIAIRMAMGAQRTDIAVLVFRTGFGPAALGCLLGASVSVIVMHLIRSFLFGISATDPLIYIWSIAIMMLITLLASAIPANRATVTDLTANLRSI